MRRFRLIVVLGVIGGAVLSVLPAQANAPTIFPSDGVTVSDPNQITGRRVNLPFPDCVARPSDCNEIALINQLDGFDLEPRIEIAFGLPIDVSNVNVDTVYVQKNSGGPHIALTRLVWSPARNTLYGLPHDLLEESTTYRVVVAGTFTGVAAESTFTTMSATKGLVAMRQQLDSGEAYAGIADRGLRFVRPNGLRTVFAAENVRTITRYDDKSTDAAVAPVAATVLNTAVAAAGSYAFGSFLSPSWLTNDRVIPNVPTNIGAPLPVGYEEVGFTLVVPAGPKPPAGWPVAIFGPGITRSKYDVFLAADLNAAYGVATMAIDPAGHAYGPRSSVAVDLNVPPSTVTFSGFGRGRDWNGNGTITEQEGVSTRGQPAPYASVALRDGLRQTAIDNMALVRAIGRGADVDGDGSVDLRPSGVTYYAQSLGGIYGTMLMGVDPLVQTGVLNVPGGPILEIARLSPAFRILVATELGNRVPSLLNGGRDGFTESTPLFIDSPVTAPAVGAVAIQEVGSRVNWLNRPGSPEAFAPLLRLRPPNGGTAKTILYQFAFGDRTVPNPTSAAIMRAGSFADVTTFYRNDLTPTFGSNPHGFLLDPRITGRNLAQLQVIEFITGGGIIDPDGPLPVFETPIHYPQTLEQLNYPLPPATGEPPPEQAQ